MRYLAAGTRRAEAWGVRLASGRIRPMWPCGRVARLYQVGGHSLREAPKAMIPSMIARLRSLSGYRRIVAVLLAGCVASFVLGQAAGHQPRSVAASVTSPSRTASVIAGALGTPAVAPPHIVVPTSMSHGHQDGNDHGGHDGNGQIVPRAIPLPKPGYPGDHHKGGSPMPPVPMSPAPEEA